MPQTCDTCGASIDHGSTCRRCLDAEDRKKAIRQATLESQGYRMRPDGTYFRGGN